MRNKNVFKIKEESIFEYLERIRKERKERKNKLRENYWKLSATERIDYDNKLNVIFKSRFPLFCLTISLFKLIFFGMLFFCVFNYFFGSSEFLVNEFTILSQKLFIVSLFSLISLSFILDLLMQLYNLFKSHELIKKLNKRFKI